MILAGCQFLPPSRLRANQAGPVDTSGVLNAVIRSQTAYTVEESCGSVVIAALSTATFGSTSTCSPAGSAQVRPRSVDRLARMARLAPFPDMSNASASWCAVPSGENEIHGSLARSYLPPVQRENFADVVAQVFPPSKETLLVIPRAPPFEYRSCCQSPIRFEGFAGFTAKDGSASALGKKVPPANGPSQPGSEPQA